MKARIINIASYVMPVVCFSLGAIAAGTMSPIAILLAIISVMIWARITC